MTAMMLVFGIEEQLLKDVAALHRENDALRSTIVFKDMSHRVALGRARAAEEKLEALAVGAQRLMEDGEKLITAAAELKAENDRLRKALRFYGNVEDYKAPFTGGMGKLWADCGETARGALEGGSR